MSNSSRTMRLGGCCSNVIGVAVLLKMASLRANHACQLKVKRNIKVSGSSSLCHYLVSSPGSWVSIR